MDEILEEAKWVVMMFDQANTGGRIEGLGSRGKYLKGAVEDLRAAMVKLGIDPYRTRNEGTWREGYGG